MADREKEAFVKRLDIAARRVGTLYALAKAAGLSDQTLYDYRRKGTDPSRGNLVALASAAGVSIEWLATGKGNRSRTAIDLTLLKWSIEAVEEGLVDLELEGISLETKVEMIADTYEMYRKDRRKPERRKVIEIIKSAA